MYVTIQAHPFHQLHGTGCGAEQLQCSRFERHHFVAGRSDDSCVAAFPRRTSSFEMGWWWNVIVWKVRLTVIIRTPWIVNCDWESHPRSVQFCQSSRLVKCAKTEFHVDRTLRAQSPRLYVVLTLRQCESAELTHQDSAGLCVSWSRESFQESTLPVLSPSEVPVVATHETAWISRLWHSSLRKLV